MHPGDREAVAGDADEADEALVARLDGGLERAAFAQRGLPLDHVDEVVQLQQVDVVDAEAVERAADLLARARAVALAGLRGEEEPVAVLRQPRCEPQLRVAVRRGRVDVVDAVLEQQLERAVGLGLRDGRRAPRRRRACACSRGRCFRTAPVRSRPEPNVRRRIVRRAV